MTDDLHKFTAFSFLAVLLALAGCLGGPEGAEPGRQALSTGEALHFVGTDGNWFEPRNWDAGRTPGPDDDVRIDGGARVQIDPTLNPEGAAAVVAVRDVLVSDGASLEALGGASLEVENLHTFAEGSFATIGATANASGGMSYNCPRWRCGYNPSYIHASHYEIHGESLTMSLGGTTPASATSTGPGHHAVVHADTVALAGTDLLVETRYGFVPSDTFVIVRADVALTGTFANYADGDTVAQYGSLALVIDYMANEVVLRAERRGGR